MSAGLAADAAQTGLPSGLDRPPGRRDLAVKAVGFPILGDARVVAVVCPSLEDVYLLGEEIGGAFGDPEIRATPEAFVVIYPGARVPGATA